MGQDEVVSESVVTGSDRSMRREHTARGHGFDGGLVRQRYGEMFPQQLENQERGVSFIQMEHAGFDAQGSQGAYAADTENHFLANAGGLVTTVQAMCNVAVRRRVLGAVGIEQVNGDAAD